MSAADAAPVIKIAIAVAAVAIFFIGVPPVGEQFKFEYLLQIYTHCRVWVVTHLQQPESFTRAAGSNGEDADPAIDRQAPEKTNYLLISVR